MKFTLKWYVFNNYRALLYSETACMYGTEVITKRGEQGQTMLISLINNEL